MLRRLRQTVSLQINDLCVGIFLQGYFFFIHSNFEQGFSDWPSAPLKDPSENGPLLKQTLGSVLWQKEALCPSSSAPRCDTENIKVDAGWGRFWLLSPLQHSWWETVNHLDSSFRVGAVSLGQNLWPGDGTHTHTHTHTVETVQYPNRKCWMFHHSSTISDLFKRRSTRTKKNRKKKISRTEIWISKDKNNHQTSTSCSTTSESVKDETQTDAAAVQNWVLRRNKYSLIMFF